MKDTFLRLFVVFKLVCGTIHAEAQNSNPFSTALNVVQTGVCKIENVHTNYGQNDSGDENWLRLDGDAQSCRNFVGTKREGRTITYTAFGLRGCHTYLDFYPSTSKEHGDSISGAWGLCDSLMNENINASVQQCNVCEDNRSWSMLRRDKECDGFFPRQYSNKCSSQNWVRNKWCQYSCFVTGNGYQGDNCCAIQASTTSPTPDPTPKPSKPPSKSPTASPTADPTAKQTAAKAPECQVCPDTASNSMVGNGKQCGLLSFGELVAKCSNDNWKSKKWCQYSCFMSGNGYEGDACCPEKTTTSPTEAPTSDPTEGRTPEPSKANTPNPTQVHTPVNSCTPCEDTVSNSMKVRNVECSMFSQLQLDYVCQHSVWKQNKYCQRSCYQSGNEYEGESCCPDQAPGATNNPTPVPSPSPTNPPPKCEPCRDDPSDGLASRGRTCGDLPLSQFEDRCATSIWQENKWCQYSCFLTGNGNEEANCCPEVQTDEPTFAPSPSPTGKPSPTPSVSPTSAPSAAPTGKPSSTPSVSPTSMPSKTPTHGPSITPSVSPTSAPSKAPTSRPSYIPSVSPTVKPSMSPTNSPSLSPTKKPTPAPSFSPTMCQPCRDDPSSGMTNRGLDCSSIPLGQFQQRCTNARWREKKFCQFSCFRTGNGHEGDNCCPEVQTDTPTSEPSPVPTTTPTFNPSASPTSEPSGKPTDEPTSTPTNSPTPSPKTSSPPKCQPCRDDPSGSMTNRGVGCKDLPLGQFQQRCANDKWREKKFCQYSCFLTGNGHDEENCCPEVQTNSPTPEPSPVPSTTPTSSPSSSPTFEPSGKPTEKPTSTPTHNPTSVPSSSPKTNPTPKCQPCKDVPSDTMSSRGVQCQNLPLNQLAERCAKANWRESKFCQYSCFLTGNGQEDDNCCPELQTDSPTSPPSPAPTGSPTVVPTSSPTHECFVDMDCSGEMTCNSFQKCVKPVCALKNWTTNYGQSSTGMERYQRVTVPNMESCRNQVGMHREGGGTIVYAAMGKWGCHTYLDYYSGEGSSVVNHGDDIKGAWGLCEQVYGGRNCSVDARPASVVDPTACFLLGVESRDLGFFSQVNRDYILLGATEEWEVAPLSIRIGEEQEVHNVKKEFSGYVSRSLDLSNLDSSASAVVSLEDGTTMACRLTVQKFW